MYKIILASHSGFRWLVLALAIFLVVKSLIGLYSGSSYKKMDGILSGSFIGLMHLQLILGLLLYFFLSPITSLAFKDFGAAMRDSELRFWAVEHLTMMILAIASAQTGRIISKKASDSSVKFKFQAIFFSVSLVLMLLSIPWDRVAN